MGQTSYSIRPSSPYISVFKTYAPWGWGNRYPLYMRKYGVRYKHLLFLPKQILAGDLDYKMGSIYLFISPLPKGC